VGDITRRSVYARHRGAAKPRRQPCCAPFGFFDGTLDELSRSQEDAGYDERVDAIADLVDAVVVNGVYEIVVDWTA
jgi:hypothetical protein